MAGNREGSTIKLVKSTSFPTYQLYAEINNKKLSCEDRFKIAILETMKWLRQRFKDIDTPEVIEKVDPKDYKKITLNSFESFHMDEGYTLDIIYLQNRQLWTMRLIEADLAMGKNQMRRPVPGRKFSTNISFHIRNNEVQCGFKTICIEPEGTIEPCEVFRLAIVKEIANNRLLGLRQIYPFIEDFYKLKTVKDIAEFKSFLENTKRKMPIVIMAEYSDSKARLLKGVPNTKIALNRIELPNDLMMNLHKDIEIKKEYPLKIKDLAKYRMSQGMFFKLPLDMIDKYNDMLSDHPLKMGETKIIYPVLDDRVDYKIGYRKNLKAKDEAKEIIDNTIKGYTKNREMTYNNIKFYNKASLLFQEELLAKSKDKKDTISALEAKLDNEKEISKEEIDKLKNIINVCERQNRILLKEKESFEEDKEAIRRKYEDILYKLEIGYEKKLQDRTREIKWLESRLETPNKFEDIPDWVEDEFDGRLIFHQRAKKEIEKADPSYNIDLICQSIQFLAYDYYDSIYGNLTEQDLNDISSKRYDRRFEVCSSGDKSVEYYPGDYKIKYSQGYKGKPVEVPLNMHLKVGIDNRTLIRIYFLLDKEKKLIVVGSLPEHLRTLKYD